MYRKASKVEHRRSRHRLLQDRSQTNQSEVLEYFLATTPVAKERRFIRTKRFSTKSNWLCHDTVDPYPASPLRTARINRVSSHRDKHVPFSLSFPLPLARSPLNLHVHRNPTISILLIHNPKMPSSKGKPTDPKLREKVKEDVKQETNKDGGGKGQWSAWKVYLRPPPPKAISSIRLQKFGFYI